MGKRGLGVSMSIIGKEIKRVFVSYKLESDITAKSYILES